MSITKVTSIKPQANLSNKINKILSKTTLRHLEQLVIKYIISKVSEAKLIQNVLALTDEECEKLELAPVEKSRFNDAVLMAVREAAKPTFNPVDGMSGEASISIDIDSQKLEKAFGLYASGSFRREAIRFKYGGDLEMLIPDNTIMRQAFYNVTIDCSYAYVESSPQIKTYNVHKNADNWITKSITKNISTLVNNINNYLEQVEV